MNKSDLIAAADRFFGDTSRSKADTRDGLKELMEHCEVLISSLGDDNFDADLDE